MTATHVVPATCADAALNQAGPLSLRGLALAPTMMPAPNSSPMRMTRPARVPVEMNVAIRVLFIAALLAGFGSPVRADALVDALRNEIAACWMPPDMTGAKPISVVVKVRLKRDGSLAAKPVAENPPKAKEAKLLAASAVRAVERCAPFHSMAGTRLPYERWRELKLNFAPVF